MLNKWATNIWLGGWALSYSLPLYLFHDECALQWCLSQDSTFLLCTYIHCGYQSTEDALMQNLMIESECEETLCISQPLTTERSSVSHSERWSSDQDLKRHKHSAILTERRAEMWDKRELNFVSGDWKTFKTSNPLPQKPRKRDFLCVAMWPPGTHSCICVTLLHSFKST